MGNLAAEAAIADVMASEQLGLSSKMRTGAFWMVILAVDMMLE